MALYKEIYDIKGIITKYHRISSVSFDIDLKKIIVKIKEYIDVTKRNEEKQYKDIQKQISLLESEIYELNQDYLNNEDIITEKQNLIQEKIEILNTLNPDLSIKENTIEMDFNDKDYSLSSIYIAIKEMDPYIDSEDI